MLEVEDPEFMVGLGRRLQKRPRFLSLGLAFMAVLIVPDAIYGGGKQALEKMVACVFPPGSEYDFQVEVIDSDWVNAVAFPGGKILISHVLLEKGHPVVNLEAPVLTAS